MSPALAVIVLGGFGAAFVVGAAGFGDALVASAVWLHVLSPREAVPLVVAIGLVIHGSSLLALRRHIRPARVWPFLLAGLLGVPFGLAMLGHAEPGPFRLSVGLLLVAYVPIALAAPRLGRLSWGGRLADGGIGLVGGVLGGLAGLSGVVPTLWCQVRGWPKDDQRGVYQPYIFAMHTVSLAGFAAAGLLDALFVQRLLWCLPVVMAGTWLGHLCYRRIDERGFRRLVMALLLFSGLTLMVQF